MNIFEEALAREYEALIEEEEAIIDLLAEAYITKDCTIDEEAFTEDFSDLTDDERGELLEAMVKRVTSRGDVSRVQSKKIRSRRASATTGMSKTSLKLRARKASRTRKRNPAGIKMAKRRRAKAMRRRKNLGLS